MRAATEQAVKASISTPVLSRVSTEAAIRTLLSSKSNSIAIEFDLEERSVRIAASVETLERTGVEMEALTACSVAALTVYDMCKSIDKGMTIGELTLLEKTGGKSGTYSRCLLYTSPSPRDRG